MKDHLSFAGAAALAARIERYWDARNHRVLCTIEKFANNNKKVIFFVRSDMLNGLPR